MSKVWYGSLTNRLAEMATKGQPIPEIGMGVTMLSYSDRHAGTIVEIFTKGAFEYIGVTQDKATRLDDNGWSESQEYAFETVAGAMPVYYRRKIKDGPDGRFRATYRNANGRWVGSERGGIRLGERDEYYDFSF